MSTTSAFLLYAALFRLSVITAGVISIVLGYRLFTHHPKAATATSTGDGSTIDARVGPGALTLKNAAPGTAFAIFGAVLISTMTIQGLPQLDLKDGAGTTGQVTLRGESTTLQSLTLKGIAAEQQKNTDGAIAAYEEAISLMAEPLNNLAWLYNERGASDKALPLARLAVDLRYGMPNYLDTLATVLDSTGHREEALKAMREAARLDPQFREKLSRLERVHPQ